MSACARSTFGASTRSGSATTASLPPCSRLSRRLGQAVQRILRRRLGRVELSLRRLRRLHRHAADRQPARRLHRRARAARGDASGARPRDELLRDRVRLPGRRPRCARPDPDLHAGGRGAVRRAIRRSARRSSSPAPLQLGEIRLETGSGVVPVRLEREGARIVFGRMEQPIPTDRAVSGGGGLLAALGVGPPSSRSSSTTTGIQHVYVALGSPEEVAALQPDLGASGRAGRGAGDQLLRRLGRALEDAHVPPAGGVAEDPATGSAAGPLASTSRATGASRSATRSRSRRASRSTGPSKLLRARGRERGARRPGRGRRLGGRRRARRVPAHRVRDRLRVSDLDLAAEPTRQKRPPSRER